ncbi:MAG: acyltransferase [Turicibacter sanguinis]|uniref:acyltransferase n=1 Tax=Turicibacter sanguinis TaxID=154288 RepID=UPI003994530A
MKNLLKSLFNIPASIINMFVLYTHKCELLGRVYINGIIRFYGKGLLQIDDGVKINSRYRNNPIGGQRFTSIYIKPGAKVVIGKNTGISNATLYASKEIVIGDNVKIGGDVKIFDTDFHSIDYKKRREKVDNDYFTKEVRIGNDVFIGTGSIILKGVNIGDCSIVGAGSVVTKSIPANQIWAGNPARFIRCIK